MMQKMVTVWLLFTAVSFSADQSINVGRYGRRIQLDGFLMEWNSNTARKWSNVKQVWYFDAINTPEGLAGYIRSEKTARYSTWIFTFDSHSNTNTIQMKIPAPGNDLYNFDQKLYDSLGMISFEWLIPWDRIGFDSTGAYAFLLTGISECGDSLPSLLITGSKMKRDGVFSASLIFRAVLIALLIIIYIVLNAKLRNRAREKRGA